MTELVSRETAAELDEFVRNHAHCHFMQTSVWGRVRSDRGWYGIVRRDENGKITGTMALLRNDLHSFKSCLLYAPRGPIFSDGDYETFDELVAAAKKLGNELGAYKLRLDPLLEEDCTEFADAAKALGFSQDLATDYSLSQPRMCYVLDLRGMTQESLLAQYHRSTRYNVRLAQRRGIERVFGTPEDVPEFCRMMAQTAEKNHFLPHDAEFFERLLTRMGDYAKLHFARQDGKIIAGTITVTYGNRSWHMYGCSDNSCLADRPNELLQWQMQSDAIAAGCDTFDFRGVHGYPTEDNPYIGLHKYKQGYGAQFRSYVGQFDLVLRPGIAALIRLAGKVRK